MPLITDAEVPKSKWKRYLEQDKKVVKIEREFPFYPSRPESTPIPKLYDLFKSMPKEELYFYYCEKIKRTQTYRQGLDMLSNLLCGILGGVAVLYFYKQVMWLIAVAAVTVICLFMIPVVKKREETLLDHREFEMMEEILGVEQYLSPHSDNDKMTVPVEAAPQSKDESEEDLKKEGMKISIDNTPLLDSLEVLKQEYQSERNKRQSFETRAGLIITILAALCIFVFNQIQIPQIIELAQAPITFFTLLKIATGALVYIGFFGTLWCVFATIRVRETPVISTELFDSYFLGQPRLTGVWDLIDEYIKFVDQHRKMNDNRATTLQHSFYWICIVIVCVIIYINI